MADYKELLRRAVEALPENNGAARRAVYEKARAALVGQLRAINPPLAARDITAHRLQLEDCIRQVEQEASEAVIASLGGGSDLPAPNVPVYFDEPPPPAKAQPTAGKALSPMARPAARQQPAGKTLPPRPLPAGGTIEEIIAAANAEHPEPVQESKARTLVRPEAKPMGKPVPKLVPPSRPHLVAENRPALPEPEARAELQAGPLHAIAEPVAPQAGDEAEDAAAVVEEIEVAAVAAQQANGRPVPSIVARAEAAKSRTSSTAFGAPIARPFEGSRRSPMLEPRRDAAGPRLEPAARGGQQAVARQQAAEPIALFNEPSVEAAMSSVREVEVDAQPADPQGAIDRAIATLDREARSEPDDDAEDTAVAFEEAIDVEPEPVTEKRGSMPMGRIRIDAPVPASQQHVNGRKAKGKAKTKVKAAAKRGRGRDALDIPLPRMADEGEPRSGISAVTIFLIVFVLLLAGAGGAGIWAWREGFIDLNAMFGQGAPVVQQDAAVTPPPAAPVGSTETPATGPGNTDTSPDVAAPTAELQQDDRLTSEPPVTAAAPATPAATTPAAATPALPLVETTQPDRLASDSVPGSDQAAALAALDPANLAGSQSLLLEASPNGTTGAVPFSGTVEWSKGTDEMGLPTLVAKANIPARNLSVDVLIRKNSEPSLPASHLMEINFHVNDGFIGGSVAGLPGVLLKNEELVQGTPLIGASARVVGNSFLFALSASPGDAKTNSDLLMTRKWMDLAVIYATGQRAIITLEKDDAAQKLFAEVGQAWQKAASN
jgi:hypothetical protein